MVETDKLTTGLRSIAGCIIDRIGLLIWPDERGPNETDVRLYLELGRLGEAAIDVVIGTSSDGQTPTVEFEHVDGGRPLSELENRRLEWARDGFWESKAFASSELFFASPGAHCDLCTFCGQEILHVFVVRFAHDDNVPTGVVLEIENGSRLWSIPSAYGNSVKTEMPDDWWPDPIRLCRVA